MATGVVSVLVLAFAVAAFRHAAAPDIFVDELIYASAGQNLSAGHGLVVQGLPFYWQPPLFFFFEWPFISIFGLTGAGTFAAALQLRLINAGIGALTAAGVFAFGWRIRGAWTAWPMALLFVTDPFVIRVTRRLYLEPFVAMWLLAALVLCYVSLGRWTWRRRAAVGVLFGLALLTKEVAGFALVIPFLLWVRRDVSWREPIAITASAVLTYMVYPLWAFAHGQWRNFIDLKVFQFHHLIGVFHINGFSTPGVPSFVQQVLTNAGDYWTSYLCISLAVPATIWLWFRGDRTGRFLASWSLASFGFIGAIAKFGSLEDQFFYYLMLPVVIVDGYAYSFALRGALYAVGTRWRRRDPVHRLALAMGGATVALGLAIAVLAPNASTWVRLFGVGQDHGYTDLLASIDEHVPRGAIIDSPGGSSEELKFAYPDGRYQLIRVLDPAQLRSEHIQWYVLSSKDVLLAAGINQPYYDYITSHAVPVWQTDEHTFADFGLWYVADPSTLPNVTFPLPPPKPSVQEPNPGGT